MPYDTPIENIIACTQATKHLEDTRKLVKNYQSSFEDMHVDLPDYKNLDKVLIELFLLNLAQCAACTYMLNLVEDNIAAVSDIAEYRVYKYTIKEDIAKSRAMGLTNLSTMCVNGDVKWISIIPDKDEFISTITSYAQI